MAKIMVYAESGISFPLICYATMKRLCTAKANHERCEIAFVQKVGSRPHNSQSALSRPSASRIIQSTYGVGEFGLRS